MDTPAAPTAPLAEPAPPPLAELPNLTTNPPTLAHAARTILAARIDDWDDRWADLNLEETETVKKLRVATRRLRTAITTFKPLLDKPKPAKHLQTKLRALTLLLGASRDAAILQTRLDEWASTKRTEAALAPLRQRLVQQESDAQAALADALDHIQRDEMVAKARQALLDNLPQAEAADGKLYNPPASVPITLALLPLLRQRFAAEQAARTHALETTAPLALHEERLAVKKLRYTLELVADQFELAPPTIAILKDVQTQLGDLHDCDVLIEMLAMAAAAGNNPTLASARARLDKQRARLLANHLDYRHKIDAAEWGQLERDWHSLLDRQASPTDEELGLAANVRLEDWPHARQVYRLALSLFDQLTEGQAVADDERLILAYAALLHDAGMVEGPHQHHHTSYKIIRKAKLAGLSKEQREQAALIARYHRRNLPSPQHQEFAKLESDAQARVSRLAAILRIADGLDYLHDGSTREIMARHDDEGYVITASGANEEAINRARVKAGLFAPAFGQPVRIEAAA